MAPGATDPHKRMKRLAPWQIGGLFAAAGLLLFVRCGAPPALAPADHDQATATECIIVAGRRIPIGTRVVTWTEPGGYSGYRAGKHFDREDGLDGERRYGTRSGDPRSLPELREAVHQFVIHYDVCGTSRQCFKVLHDVRKLSVHFLLDVDGTIYQTLDLKERAWHATLANDGAVGVEIAHPGAWLSPLNADMRRWYVKDEAGWRMKYPGWLEQTGVYTQGFIPRPDRDQLVSGNIQGKEYHQFDFTSEQYEALAKLIVGLNQALPRIALASPRDASGAVVDRVLPADDLLRFDGVIGHLHVQANKQDPGPAFQWDRVLDDARRLRAR